MLDITKISGIEVDGIDTNDYPDLCDAYISAANIEIVPDFVRPMTKEELDELNDNSKYKSFVYDKIMEYLH